MGSFAGEQGGDNGGKVSGTKVVVPKLKLEGISNIQISRPNLDVKDQSPL